MKLIYKSQGWRKTTKLLKLAKKIDGIVIVSDIHLKKYLIQTKRLNKDSCYSMSEVLKGALLGRYPRPILIDDADKILENLVGSTITMC
ncbi:hypothetical protein LCGC14_1759020, partial [marine sediment metagenome]